MAESLEHVLTEARGELPLLRKRRGMWTADDVEQFVDRIAEAAHEYLTFVSERDAMIRSNRSVAWLRTRYANWEREGNARRNPRNPRDRQYRLMIIPLAAQTEAARADARRTARGDRGAA